MTSELTFEAYAQSLTEASSILPDDAIAGYIMQDKMQPVMLYCYRIAAFVARDLKNGGKMPAATDDTDYIDAVQECVLHVQGMVRNWSKKPTHRFATYVNRACTNIITNYLWTLAKGGMGSGRSAAPIVEQFPEPNPDSEEDGEYSLDSAEFAYDNPPFGYRDPMIEAMALEEFDQIEDILDSPLPRADMGVKRRILNA